MIEPITATFLFTTGFSFIGWLADKVGEKVIEKYWNKLNDKDKELDNKFLEIVDTVAKKLQAKEIYKDILGNDIAYFFKQEGVLSEITKLSLRKGQLDINTLKSYFDVETLPDHFIEDFIKELTQELLRSRDFNEIFTDREIYYTIIGISSDISQIVSNTRELKEIKKVLSDLKSEFNIEYFVSNYTKITLNNLSIVDFIGLDISPDFKKGRDRKKLRDIFIKMNFNTKNLGTFRFHKLFKYIGTDKNAVILGGPGSGKSLLTKFIVYSLLDNTSQDFFEQDYRKLPFRIELRKYLTFKKEHNKGIFEFLLNQLGSETQIDNISLSGLRKLFLTNKVLILFDGLDEIFNVLDKTTIKNDIENFCAYYSNVQAIVTSRIIGYNEVSFNNNFTEINIEPFNFYQVEEYVRKSYTHKMSEGYYEDEISSFLEQSRKIPHELITNPLLLSLVVILYQNSLELPKSRLDTYKSCTKTLVDKWEKMKDISIGMTSDKILPKKTTILSDLAFWQYQLLSSGKESFITHDTAKMTIISTIIEKLKLTEDINEAEVWASEFLEYAEKRSIYFDNNFTHKTFLEYYTSLWIYTNYEKKHRKTERNNIISKYVFNSYWKVVLELLICQIDDEQTDNEIIDELITYQMTNQNEYKSYPFCISILPTLRNISDSVTKKIIYDSLSLIIKHRKSAEPNEREMSVLTEHSMKDLYEDKFQVHISNTLNNEIFHQIKENKQYIYNYIIFWAEFYFGIQRNIRVKNILQFAPNDFFKTYQFEDTHSFIAYNFILQKDKDSFLDKIELFVKEFGIDSFWQNDNFRYQWSWVFEHCMAHIFSNVNNVESIVDRLEKSGILFTELTTYYRKNNTLGVLPNYIENYIEEIISTISKVKQKDIRFFLIKCTIEYVKIYVMSSDKYEAIFLNAIRSSPLKDLFFYMYENRSNHNLEEEITLRLNLI